MLKKLGGVLAVCCLTASLTGIVSMTITTRNAYALDPSPGCSGWGKACSGSEHGGYVDCNTCCDKSCSNNCLSDPAVVNNCATTCAISC